MRLLLVALAAGISLGAPASADEPAGSLVKFFKDVCIGKLGQLDEVEDWAADQNLHPIVNPNALAVFAGKANRDGKMISVAGGGVPGSGKAWAIPDDAGRFVLATRQDPESCVIWAQKADPAAVEAAFARIVEEAARPGVDVTRADDKTVDIPNGQVHIRVQRVWAGSALNSLALIEAVVSRAGGPFQAMLETQRLVGRDDPINPMVPLEPPN